MNQSAPELPKSGLWVTQQGRPAWPARRCSSEPEIVVIDRLPEQYDEGEPLTRWEAVRFWVGISTPATLVVGVSAYAYLVRHGYL